MYKPVKIFIVYLLLIINSSGIKTTVVSEVSQILTMTARIQAKWPIPRKEGMRRILIQKTQRMRDIITESSTIVLFSLSSRFVCCSMILFVNDTGYHTECPRFNVLQIIYLRGCEFHVSNDLLLKPSLVLYIGVID